jgi:DNA topoisomerase-1
MHEETRVLAGECTIADGETESPYRGDVVVLRKPDGTVLVHDADGYQPVDWLTRAETVTLADGVLTATDGDRFLRIEVHETYGDDSYPVSAAGIPVGDCPDCGGSLVRDGGTVTCLDCRTDYGLPRDATILTAADDCDCGCPRMRVERGRAFEVCLDRDCESLDEAVRAAFDREWDCPNCDGDLRVLRRGGLLAGCEHYPDCETGWGIPTGAVVDECGCGLPVFETANGRRCLDSGCGRAEAAGPS